MNGEVHRQCRHLALLSQQYRFSNNIYALGGVNNTTNFDAQRAINTVERTTIQSDGSLSDWSYVNPISHDRSYFPAVIYGNHVYAIGGTYRDRLSNRLYLSSVEYTEIQPDGTLGAWEQTSPMIMARGWHKAVIAGRYIYVFIGRNRVINPITSIERTLINMDGSLSAWEHVGNTTHVKACGELASIQDYVYFFDGDCSAYRGSATFARISADGTLGQWTPVEGWDGRLSPHDLSPHTAVVTMKSNLYVLSGRDVFEASIDVQGMTSNWQWAGAMDTGRHYFDAVSQDDHLYAIGGTSSADGGILGTVSFAKQLSPTPTASQTATLAPTQTPSSTAVPTTTKTSTATALPTSTATSTVTATQTQTPIPMAVYLHMLLRSAQAGW